MGKNIGKLLAFLALACFLMSGCGRRKTEIESGDGSQSLKNFSMEFFGDSFKASLKGEAAEKKPSDMNASVARPSFEISSKSFILQIKTGSNGTGEVFLDPATQNITKIVIKNSITIVQKNPDSSQTNFTASCGRLTYIEKEETVIMEETPELMQGSNRYRADRITYNLNENRLRFEGNVQISFKKEATGSN